MPFRGFRERRKRASNGFQRPWLRVVFIGTLVLAVSAVLFALLFDANWLKAPIERRIAASTGRAAVISEVQGSWQRGPGLVLRDIEVGDDARDPLFKARELSFVVSPWPLLWGELQLSEIALRGAAIHLERDRKGEANWTRRDSGRRDSTGRDDAREPLWKTVRVGAIELDDVVLTLRDEVTDVEARARVDTMPAAQRAQGWQNRVQLSGRYEKTRLSGQGVTGPVITLRDTGAPFPFKARVEVGRTVLGAEGQIADLLGDTSFDARIDISGPSLSTLYPTLPVALPSTPPYRLQGWLHLHERHYRLQEIVGRIGRSDIRGHGDFRVREPRPMLTASLLSDRLALADLGALIGVPQSDDERARPPACCQKPSSTCHG